MGGQTDRWMGGDCETDRWVDRWIDLAILVPKAKTFYMVQVVGQEACLFEVVPVLNISHSDSQHTSCRQCMWYLW